MPIIRAPGITILLSAVLTFCSCVSSPWGKAREPDWISDPYAGYNRQTYVAAVGSGNSRAAAEKNALGNMIAIFGQSVRLDEKVSQSYQEAVMNGVIASWSDMAVDSTVISTAGMDSLVGAEIPEAWHNGGGLHYARAVLSKAQAAHIYSGLIRSNQSMIEKLLDMSPAEKNSFEGFARYQLAATMADLSIGYGNLLTVIGAPISGLRRGEDYRLEAINISREIPVSLNVRNDKAGRIEGAFAGVLAEHGFRSGRAASRYVLDVLVTTTAITIAGNQNAFTRIEVKADLTDTFLGIVLLPFNFNDRQGHITQSEADNRAYAAAERNINAAYSALFGSYLSSLLLK